MNSKALRGLILFTEKYVSSSRMFSAEIMDV